jgi:hypothetical protein
MADMSASSIPSQSAGRYLAPVSIYAPPTQQVLTVTTASMAAFNSGVVCTGNFTAPASGKVKVTASFVVAELTAGVVAAIGLCLTGQTSTLYGNSVNIEVNSITAIGVQTPEFYVSNLTPGNVYNFDLMGCAALVTGVSILAIGQTSVTPNLTATGRGGPVIMTVAAL